MRLLDRAAHFPRLAVLLIAVALLALTACEPGPAQDPTVPVTAAPGDTFGLAVGQTATISPDQLTVTLVRIIEDSRCPANVSCVWSGQLIVELQMAGPGEAPATIQVNSIDTYRNAGKPNFENYNVSIVKAAPSRFIQNFGKPDSTIRPIANSEYLVSFTITRLP